MYYSQYGQDKFIDESIFGKQENGIFLDIGAHDGSTLSNTLFFEETRSWTGICIEPNPHIFTTLQASRKCSCYNCCIAASDTYLTFLAIDGYANMLSGILDKYDHRHLERIKTEIEQFGGSYEEIQVESKTINGLLALHDIQHVDYCSIDTEGNEFDIIKSIDFSTLSISVFSIENNYNEEGIYNYLTESGYVLIDKMGPDEIYVKP